MFVGIQRCPENAFLLTTQLQSDSVPMTMEYTCPFGIDSQQDGQQTHTHQLKPPSYNYTYMYMYIYIHSYGAFKIQHTWFESHKSDLLISKDE